MEKMCINCQNLFSGINKRNVINLPFVELAQRVGMVKANPTKPLVLTQKQQVIWIYFWFFFSRKLDLTYISIKSVHKENLDDDKEKRALISNVSN